MVKKGILAAIDRSGINPPEDASDADWARYGQLLEKVNDEHYQQDQKEIDELAALIVKCKRTANDVCEDVTAIMELHKCHACFKDGKCKKKIEWTIAAMEAHDRETDQLITKLRADREFEKAKMQEDLNVLNNRHQQAKMMVGKIDQLKSGRRGLEHIPNVHLSELEK